MKFVSEVIPCDFRNLAIGARDIRTSDEKDEHGRPLRLKPFGGYEQLHLKKFEPCCIPIYVLDPEGKTLTILGAAARGKAGKGTAIADHYGCVGCCDAVATWALPGGSFLTNVDQIRLLPLPVLCDDCYEESGRPPALKRMHRPGVPEHGLLPCAFENCAQKAEQFKKVLLDLAPKQEKFVTRDPRGAPTVDIPGCMREYILEVCRLQNIDNCDFKEVMSTTVLQSMFNEETLDLYPAGAQLFPEDSGGISFRCNLSNLTTSQLNHALLACVNCAPRRLSISAMRSSSDRCVNCLMMGQSRGASTPDEQKGEPAGLCTHCRRQVIIPVAGPSVMMQVPEAGGGTPNSGEEYIALELVKSIKAELESMGAEGATLMSTIEVILHAGLTWSPLKKYKTDIVIIIDRVLFIIEYDEQWHVGGDYSPETELQRILRIIHQYSIHGRFSMIVVIRMGGVTGVDATKASIPTMNALEVVKKTLQTALRCKHPDPHEFSGPQISHWYVNYPEDNENYRFARASEERIFFNPTAAEDAYFGPELLPLFGLRGSDGALIYPARFLVGEVKIKTHAELSSATFQASSLLQFQADNTLQLPVFRPLPAEMEDVSINAEQRELVLELLNGIIRRNSFGCAVLAQIYGNQSVNLSPQDKEDLNKAIELLKPDYSAFQAVVQSLIDAEEARKEQEQEQEQEQE